MSKENVKIYIERHLLFFCTDTFTLKIWGYILINPVINVDIHYGKKKVCLFVVL
jgi:hypothetical protein